MISNAFTTYAGARFALDRHDRRANNQPTFLSSLVRATGLAFYVTVLIPVAFLRLLNGIHITRTEPPAPAAPYRGTNRFSGRPLRTFQDSLDDLQDDAS